MPRIQPTSVTVDDETTARWTELAESWTGGNRSRAFALALAVAAPLMPSMVADIGRVPDATAAAEWAARLAGAGPQNG